MPKNIRPGAPLKILIVDAGGVSYQIAHDLGASGASVFFLTNYANAVAMPRNVTAVSSSSFAPADKLASIDNAVKAVRPDVIMPLAEEILFTIWDEAPDWLELVHPAVDSGLTACYRDKCLMTSLIANKGVPVPETHQLERDTAAEILPIIDNLNLPIVVKGARGSAGTQVSIAETTDGAVQAVCDLYSRTGTYPALQEYIEGPSYQVGGLFDRGRPIHLLVAEKTQMLPARTGPAIALKSCNEPELVNAAITVFSVLGHSGLAGADFVRDADGRFYFLEVNPRVWGSYGFAKAIGIDLFSAWYRQLFGEQLPTSTSFPSGLTWAKMPEYLLAQPKTRGNILRRALHPLAIRSWSWREPRVLLNQLRRAYWAFKGTD